MKARFPVFRQAVNIGLDVDAVIPDSVSTAVGELRQWPGELHRGAKPLAVGSNRSLLPVRVLDQGNDLVAESTPHDVEAFDARQFGKRLQLFRNTRHLHLLAGSGTSESPVFVKRHGAHE